MANKTFDNVKANIYFTKAANAAGLTHASNIDGSTAPGMDVSLAFGKIQNWYDNWDPIVWTGVAKAVVLESNTFTNTLATAALTANVTQTFPAVSGTVLNTGTTSYTQTVQSTATGAYKIGTIKINNFETDIYGVDTDHITSATTTGSGNAVTSVTADATGALTVTKGSTFALSSHNHDSTYAKLKPDGTTDLYDPSTFIINSKYLPSYVDDIIEGHYDVADGKFYKSATFTVTSSAPANWDTTYTNYYTRHGTSPNYTYEHVTGTTAPEWQASTYYSITPSTEITGESGKIYVDLDANPAEIYRWSGTQFVSMKSPDISAVRNVVAGTTNGTIKISYTDGTADSTVTAYTHPTTAGNKHIPAGGSSGQILKWSAAGTATWANVSSLSTFTGATSSSAAGTAGIVPAPAATTYTSGTNRHYLRSDGTWSDDPVTTQDTLTLNIVPATA
jgi:hypothetical protein